VNSYKRLVTGFEALVNISWARINRSALICVPRATSTETTRIELRNPDPSCNPIPGSLNQALNAMETDDEIRASLGAHTYERFISAKRLEWEDYRLEVSEWELQKYLPNY